MPRNKTHFRENVLNRVRIRNETQGDGMDSKHYFIIATILTQEFINRTSWKLLLENFGEHLRRCLW